MTLLTLLLLPFLGSLVAGALPTRRRNAASAWAGLVALVGTIRLLMLFPEVQHGGVVREHWSWIPSIGLDLVIRLDGFAWMFAMLVMGIGTLVVLYARYYMSPDDPVARFFSFFLAFMGAMLGVVTAGNLVVMVFFWELTSLFSFLLIGYWYHRSDARRGARMALTVTGTGGLALLAGVLMIGHVVGSFDLDVVLASGDTLRESPLYLPILLLVLLGALTKSAQFPFHFWLPHAMAAPTPVSSYLHSATMVKAGVFLLARLWPVLSGTEAWFWLVGGAGVITLLLGAYTAMFQNDLKGLLAYSTISHLGLITLALGLNSPLAAVAAVFHVMNHATFKASLFMAAGIVDHESGTRDIRRLGGLWKLMPITGTLAIVASASMAGVPLLNGFLSKEMFFAETVYISSRVWVDQGLPVVATLSGLFAVVYALRFSHDVFFGGESADIPRHPHEPSGWMLVPVALLVSACVLVGVLPAFSIGPMLGAAALPVVGGDLPEFSLALWHGLNKPLLMSLVALAGGILAYGILRRAQAHGYVLQPPLTHFMDGKRFFEAALAGLTRLSRAGVERFGSHRLQTQLFLLVTVTFFVGWLAMGEHAFAWGERPRVPATPEFVLMWTVGIACAIGAAVQAKFHRLAALTMLGGAGLVTCLTFVWFSAPDLALTQLAVEVVTTVLFLLGLRWLPKRLAQDEDELQLRIRLRRIRDFSMALAAGGGLAALSYAMQTRPAPQSIAPFYLEKAVPEGGGTNVVNVMLVDFRGFDTLGEVTVLVAVALTIYALLRRFRPLRESIEMPEQQRMVPAGRPTDLIKPRLLAVTAAFWGTVAVGGAAEPAGGKEGEGAGSRGMPEADMARVDQQGYLMVPTVLVRLLLPFAGAVALYLLLRGHNEPGGGFVAGLLVAIALITQYMMVGASWVEAHLAVRPLRWMALGLLAAVGTGLASIYFGFPFLTTHTAHVTLPWVGELQIASAMFFDLGVFAVVVGATVLILIALAHQSLRARRRPLGGDDDGRAD